MKTLVRKASQKNTKSQLEDYRYSLRKGFIGVAMAEMPKPMPSALKFDLLARCSVGFACQHKA
jgi:hypothetical protein